MKKNFWSKVEQAGEGMEIGMRCLIGFIFCVILCPGAFALGNSLHGSLGIIMAFITIPFAFIFGFFWIEIKFAIRLLAQLFLGI